MSARLTITVAILSLQLLQGSTTQPVGSVHVCKLKEKAQIIKNFIEVHVLVTVVVLHDSLQKVPFTELPSLSDLGAKNVKVIKNIAKLIGIVDDLNAINANASRSHAAATVKILLEDACTWVSTIIPLLVKNSTLVQVKHKMFQGKDFNCESMLMQLAKRNRITQSIIALGNIENAECPTIQPSCV